MSTSVMKKFGAFALFFAGVAAGAVGLSLKGYFVTDGVAQSAPDQAAEPPKLAVQEVTLSDEKLRTAGIRAAEVARTTVHNRLEVPGVVTLDPDKVVEVRPRITGIVRQVDALLGQKIKAGQRLVLLESADVGSARLDVRMRRFAMQVAKGEQDWREQMASNVAQLMVELASRPDEKDVELKFANKPLGADRALLLSNYAKFEMAIHEEEKQQDLFDKRLIGEHLLRQAKHDREAAQALFESAMEQTKFDVAHELRIAQEKLQTAEVNLIDAVQRLRLLGVPDDDPSVHLDLSSSTPIDADWTKSIIMEDVAAYPILAPFDGTITRRSVVPSQRVESTDTLFTLADLNFVRVEAKIAEKDFAALGDIKIGDSIDLAIPLGTLPERTAKVIYVGTQLDTLTRTVPVVAEADNADGRLRPGQFCRVRLQATSQSDVLAVPASALVEIEGKPGVFLADESGKTFRFQPIVVERQPSDAKEMVVVTEGLKVGQSVVTEGAFVLKSELILASEPEEE